MGKIHVSDISKLQVYQRSFDLSVKIYHLTKNIKLHSLRDQIQRCSTSVFANISEGVVFKDIYPAKTINFLCSSVGSINETKTWLLFFLAINIIDSGSCDQLVQECSEISLMLCSMINNLSSQISDAKENKKSSAVPLLDADEPITPISWCTNALDEYDE